MNRHFEQSQSRTMLADLFSSTLFALVLGLSLFGIFIGFAMIFIIVKYYRFRSVWNVLICNTCVSALGFFSVHIEISIIGFQSTNLNCSIKSFTIVLFISAFVYSNVLQAIYHLSSVLSADKRFLLRWSSNIVLISVSWIISLIIPSFPLAFDAFVSDEKLRFCSISTSSLVFDLYLIVFIVIFPLVMIVSSYVYVQHRYVLLNSPILGMIGTDFAMRILTKKHRRELKNLFVLLVQMAIFLLGFLPTAIFMFVSRSVGRNDIRSKFSLIANAILPISMTILLAVTSLTNRLSRKILIAKHSNRSGMSTIAMD